MGVVLTQIQFYDNGSSLWSAKVYPQASQNKVVLHSTGIIKIYVTQAPEKGKANAAVCSLLAKTLGIRKAMIQVVRGATSQNKQILIQEKISREYILRCLSI